MCESIRNSVDLLILGAGWTSTFLIPLCLLRGVSYVATSRAASPKPDTIVFDFDPTSDDSKPFAVLPNARTVLITFPIKLTGASEKLVNLYERTHPNMNPGYIQLGSTGIWRGASETWVDRHSPIVVLNDRAAAEEELLALSYKSKYRTTVLNLSGLCGGERSMRHVVGRIAPSKEALKMAGSLHMIHGEDVSRAILAVHHKFHLAIGQRWLLTDGRVYDWWDLASAWGDVESKPKPGNEQVVGEREKPEDHEKGPQPRWARELMNEGGIRALPRSVERIGRGLDSREFWTTFELQPIKARLE